MSITADFTIRETSALSGVPLKTIEKAVEARVLQPIRAPARFRGAATRYFPLKAVGYFHALQAADLKDLPIRHKRAIWRCIVRTESVERRIIEFAPGAMLDLERLSSDSLSKAERYRQARDHYIVSNPEILGGTPAVTGTRLTVYAILGRLRDGESVDDLLEDYPEVPAEAFEAAEIYAKAHPLRGRPSGRPWRQTA